MYFIRKNLLNILISMLVFGILGTFVNLFLPHSSSTYEEYYTIENEINPNTIANLNVKLNENVNNNAYNRKIVSIEGQTYSDILKINLLIPEQLEYESIKDRVIDVLSEEQIVIIETIDVNVYKAENNLFKMFIILLSLTIGIIIGILQAVFNKKLTTEDDISHYLDERTLGTF